MARRQYEMISTVSGTCLLLLVVLVQPAFSQPNISAAPTEIDFGTVCPEKSLTSEVTISNLGTADLEISDIDTEPMPGDKVIFFGTDENGGSSPCGSTKPTIAAGSSCTVSVRFNPLGEGPFTGRLIIESNDLDTPVLIILLTGNGDFDACSAEDLGVDTGSGGCFISTVTSNSKKTSDLSSTVE